MAASPISVSAPAKVNLYLAVGARRPDGYHDVTTVLQALELADEVTLEPDAPLSVVCEPPLGIPAEENIVARAARELAVRTGREPAGRFVVVKRLPAGGGLGGGSADAAAALRALCAAWDVEPTDASVTEAARAVGADVPFFLVGGAALFVGRGDVLARQLPSLHADVVLVNPGPPVPTPAAYAAFDRLLAPAPPAVDTLLRTLEDGRVPEALYNGLAEAAVSVVPEISDVLGYLRATPGVVAAQVAGSGSTVFGLCEDAATAAAAADGAQKRGWWASATRTSDAGAALLGS
ncbi:MAG: 4-(cytidine 5'-diphospho)-2-C-methyl-D-erythritol kinase [Anaerosomatales bacterium]|nr:4-(cytidine 5'-diphospho)-2-C-methyl-D-erythritol kinase [Anaerosomatales bacterium]